MIKRVGNLLLNGNRCAVDGRIRRHCRLHLRRDVIPLVVLHQENLVGERRVKLRDVFRDLNRIDRAAAGVERVADRIPNACGRRVEVDDADASTSLDRRAFPSRQTVVARKVLVDHEQLIHTGEIREDDHELETRIVHLDVRKSLALARTLVAPVDESIFRRQRHLFVRTFAAFVRLPIAVVVEVVAADFRDGLDLRHALRPRGVRHALVGARGADALQHRVARLADGRNDLWLIRIRVQANQPRGRARPRTTCHAAHGFKRRARLSEHIRVFRRAVFQLLAHATVIGLPVAVVVDAVANFAAWNANRRHFHRRKRRRRVLRQRHARVAETVPVRINALLVVQALLAERNALEHAGIRRIHGVAVVLRAVLHDLISDLDLVPVILIEGNFRRGRRRHVVATAIQCNRNQNESQNLKLPHENLRSTVSILPL